MPCASAAFNTPASASPSPHLPGHLSHPLSLVFCAMNGTPSLFFSPKKNSRHFRTRTHSEKAVHTFGDDWAWADMGHAHLPCLSSSHIWAPGLGSGWADFLMVACLPLQFSVPIMTCSFIFSTTAGCHTRHFYPAPAWRSHLRQTQADILCLFLRHPPKP